MATTQISTPIQDPWPPKRQPAVSTARFLQRMHPAVNSDIITIAPLPSKALPNPLPEDPIAITTTGVFAKAPGLFDLNGGRD